MTPILVRGIAELAAVALLLFGSLMLIRHYTTRERKPGDPMGIGWRAIQTIGVTMAVPTILIAALEGIISHDVAGALFGSIIGFVFAPRG